MISINTFTPLMPLFALTIPCVSTLVKEVPFSFYPAQYAALTESDWPSMKSTLEAALIVKPSEHIDDALAGRALFTLARISRIRWNASTQPEVATYLLTCVSRLLSQEGKVAVGPTSSETDARRRLVHRAIWCYGEVAVSLDQQKLTEIWAVSPQQAPAWHGQIRGAILDVLNRRFLDGSVPAIAATFLEDGGTQATQAERESINRVLLRRTLTTFKDQSEAWKHIWRITKPTDLHRVCTTEFRLQWYQRILLFQSVFAEPDERSPFALAEASEDLFEKYVFLYSSVFLANMKMGTNKAVDEEFLNRLESAGEKVVQQAVSLIDRDATNRRSDYLEDALESMRTNAAKQRDLPPDRDGTRRDEGYVRASTESRQSMLVAPPKANPPTEHPTPRFSRPEDRGEDFTKVSTKELVHRLAVAKNVGEQRKGAKVLGDRAILGNLDLDSAEKQVLQEYIASQVLLTASSKGDERQEAIAQLQRLWRLSAPRLLDSLGDANLTVQEAAIKNLCLMRDESIVKAIITRVDASEDANFRHGAVFALGMMREKRHTMVPDRKVLGDAASEELAKRLIIPFLDRLDATNSEPAMKEIIANARRFLNSPFDSRPRTAAKPADRTPAEPEGMPSGGSPVIAPVVRDNTMSKPSGSAKTSFSLRPYVLAGLGSVVGLLGVVWFGYRRLRKAT